MSFKIRYLSQATRNLIVARSTTGSPNVADRTELSVLRRHLCSVSIKGNPFKWQIKCETHHLLGKQEDIGQRRTHTFGNIFLFNSI